MPNEYSRNQANVFVVAHPDDSEAMLGYKIARSANPWVIVATDGTASTEDRIGGDFVARGERRQESYSGLECLGVPRKQQVYLGLPDGEVEKHTPAVRDAILEVLASTALAYTTIITLGKDGYDYHADHKATHQSAIECAQTLEHCGRPAILGLSSTHRGTHIERGQPHIKLDAIRYHKSQFAPDDHAFWYDFNHYVPLILAGETYDTYCGGYDLSRPQEG